jgi:hypothetical protein
MKTVVKDYNSFAQAEADMELRVAASKAVEGWTGNKHEDGVELAKVLGMKHYHQIVHNMSPEMRRKLELLVGPNGYAIYKAMLARKDG